MVKKKKKNIVVSAKKKTSVATASIKPGKGIIRINKQELLSFYSNKYLLNSVIEPLKLIGQEITEKYNLNINVSGGGMISQNNAVRSVIAKAFEAITKDQKLRERLIHFDRTLLVDDVRRKEAKKPLGKGARARKQTSKR